MREPEGEPLVTVTWRAYNAVVALVLTFVIVLPVPRSYGRSTTAIVAAAAFAALSLLVLGTTAMKAVLTRDELILTTALRRTRRIPLGRVGYTRWGAGVRERGTLRIWRIPPGRETWTLFDAIDELRGSSTGTTSSGRAAGS